MWALILVILTILCLINLIDGHHCSPNETYVDCSTLCEPKCGDPTPICEKRCGEPKCQCIRDYLRNLDNGRCVLPKDCPCPGPNEEYKICNTCEANCTNPEPICTLECKPPGCRCKDGFLRDVDGICVGKNDCSTPDTGCAAVLCLTGSTCEIDKNGKPICRPNACATVRCMAGFHCMVDCAGKAQCFPDDPCTGITCQPGQQCVETGPKCQPRAECKTIR